MEDVVVFSDLVNPILPHKCASYHNPTKKKGGLSFYDTIAFKKDGKNGAAFVAGETSRTALRRRVLVLLSHEYLMPPKGKTPLTEEEKHVYTIGLQTMLILKKK